MRPPSTLQLVFAAVCGSVLFWLVWLGTPNRTDENPRTDRLRWAARERARALDYEGARAFLRECVRIEGPNGKCAARMSAHPVTRR